MSSRLEDFLRELPGRGVPDNAVQLYRTVLTELEQFLGKAAALRFSKYEINRFVTARQRAGATERELKNITTACTAYLGYCEALAPAPAVGTAGEPDESPAAQLTAPPPPEEQRKVLYGALGALVLVVCLIGGCLASKARQSRVERDFSQDLRQAGMAVTTIDNPALRRRVMALAEARGIRVAPNRIVAAISPLSPENMNRLPMDQRMTAVQLIQNQMRAAVPREDRFGRVVREHAAVDQYFYVEIDVIGEIPGIFGAHKFDLELHVLGGATAPFPKPP